MMILVSLTNVSGFEISFIGVYHVWILYRLSNIITTPFKKDVTCEEEEESLIKMNQSIELIDT